MAWILHDVFLARPPADCERRLKRRLANPATGCVACRERIYVFVTMPKVALRNVRLNSRHTLEGRTCPFCGAGSTGRRNTGIKSLCWGFKLQGLTWPFVELTSHFVQIGLRMHRQVGALRKVLSQQTIGVLIRAALPWALRIAKIYVDFGRQRKATMIRKFLSPVPGQGLIQLLW